MITNETVEKVLADPAWTTRVVQAAARALNSMEHLDNDVKYSTGLGIDF